MSTVYNGAWCAETSSDPDAWTPENPAWGQCAVTALVVQDLFGGQLLRSTVGGISHYWNRLPDNSEKDLTIQQFGYRRGVLDTCHIEVDAPPVVRDRDYVLSFPETSKRYTLLRKRMGL